MAAGDVAKIGNSMRVLLDTIKQRQSMIEFATDDANDAKSRLAVATKQIADLNADMAKLKKEQDRLRKLYDQAVAENRKNAGVA